MRKTLIILLALLTCVGCFAQQSGGRIYKIGETGPAGGIVFYDKGFTEDGWRYLEAAPAGKEFEAQWSAKGVEVAGTSTKVGSGKKNTQLIVAALNAAGETEMAAQLCASLNFGGKNDWFLPSRDELGAMYNSLVRMGIGSFTTIVYWSSSQGKLNGSSAWGQRCSDGLQLDSNKNGTYLVRAVRAF